MSQDNDVQLIAEAYAALSKIPLHSNRRMAALWYIRARVGTDIRHYLDGVAIDAVNRCSTSPTPPSTPTAGGTEATPSGTPGTAGRE